MITNPFIHLFSYEYVQTNIWDLHHVTFLYILCHNSGMSIINEAKRVGSLRTAYRITNSSLFVWEVCQNLGYRYTYINAAYWPPPQFYAVTNPQPGDVLLFSGYVGIYTRTGYFYGPQVSTGPTEVPFGLNAPYWGSQTLLRGCYHWRG